MNPGESAFVIALMQELMTSMSNWYGPENWDAERFGPYQSSGFKSSMVTKFNELFSGKVAVLPVNTIQLQIQSLSRIEDSLEGLAAFYQLLADESSRSTLVRVLAYRLMGPKHVKLPLNTSSYWSTRESTRSMIKGADTLRVKFPNLVLNHMALAEIGYPIELYFAPSGVMVTFILKQYEYGHRTPAIKAQPGDYVIDAGGCWGDTALYFAHSVGEHGKVYTFEFTPENLEILNRNLDLNPPLSPRVEVVPRALWEVSGEVIHYSANGPGTSLALAKQNNHHQDSAEVTTITIDDFVNERTLPRVDFIKMDIEGAELSALKGAEKTIRTFRPTLAISIYHRQEDFIAIPLYLNQLGVGYEFFLDHFTIYGEETILFARPVQ